MNNYFLQACNEIHFTGETTAQGRPFKSRFLEPGLVKYDFGMCLLKKQTIDKFVDSFLQKPLVIGHIEDEEINNATTCGTINEIWYNPSDGWFWCSGFVSSPEAIQLINNGYNISCKYVVTDWRDNNEGKLYHNIKYDKEILDGVFKHLAIVDEPRYEDALIVVNSLKKKRKTMFKSTQKKVDELANAVYERLVKKFALEASNECNKDAENEEVDKRKLIDEVAGIMKSAGADDELIRTAIKKMELMAYDKSEADAADNECDKSAENEEVDKRDLIRQIMAIAGKHEDNEDVRTIAKLAEKLAYDKSEAGTADNETDEKEQKEEAFKEFKKDVVADVCNSISTSVYKKVKASLYGKTGEFTNKSRYISQAQGIKNGDKIYS